MISAHGAQGMALALLAGTWLLGCADEEAEEATAPRPPAVASVLVTPVASTLVSLSETVQLTASARDENGNAIAGKAPTWSSSDVSIATVSSSGVVTAMANGSAIITATTDGIKGTATILVDQVPSQLAFTLDPTETHAAGSIMPAVEVAIQDASGIAVKTATHAVTLAFGTNPSAATLSGRRTEKAVNGTASFSDLSIDKSGVGYTLVATSSELTSATSRAFNITPPTELPPGVDEVPFERLESVTRLWSGIDDPQRMLISEAAQWEAFWAELERNVLPKSNPPPIDFTRNIVVVAAMGVRPTGGHVITIEAVHGNSEGLFVEVLEVSPGPRCVVTQALTAPVDAVLVQASADESVIFIEREDTFDCQ